jgi:tetratricopeptide (TPR) repeat protein
MILAIGLALPAFAGDDLDADILKIRSAWDHANYELKGDAREKALGEVAKQAEALVAKHPNSAKALAWQGIALGTWAGAKGGLGALGLAKQARDALLKAEHIDPKVFGGSVYTTLGSLYYRVPGWPIGFGDDDKAKDYFQKALRLNPDGLDPNYFYGDFLLEQGQYEQAVKVLKHALEAPPRPERPVADQGRRKQVEAALRKAMAHTS